MYCYFYAAQELWASEGEHVPAAGAVYVYADTLQLTIKTAKDLEWNVPVRGNGRLRKSPGEFNRTQ